MTAPQSIESVNGSKGNVLQEAGPQETELQADRPKSIVQQIESAVLDSQIDLGSLEFISELLLNDDKQVCSSNVGCILRDYVKKIYLQLEQVELLVSDLQREIKKDSE